MDVAFSFLVPCAIIAVVSVPMMFNLVPPNRVYGFRTRRTLADRELWFRANRFLGWALFIAAVMSAAIFLLEPGLSSPRSVAGLLVFVVPLIVALVASFAYARAADAEAAR